MSHAMKKEARANLRIFVFSALLLVVMIGIVHAITITITQPGSGARISTLNGSTIILNVTIGAPAGEVINITNVTWYYNGSAGRVFIGTNTSTNLTSWAFNWSVPQLNGTFVITANVSNASETIAVFTYNTTNITISIDNILPAVTLDYPINGSFSNGLLRYTANDSNLDTCLVYVNGSLIDTNKTGTGELVSGTQFTLNLSRTAVTVADGPSLNASVWCNDTYGNVNATGLFLNASGTPTPLSGLSQLIFTKDTVFPVVRILSPIDNSNQSSRTISIQVNMTDLNADSCILFTNHTGTFALNGTDRAVTNANLSFNITIGNDLQFRYNVSCNDSAGNSIINKSSNTVAADFQTITIDNTPPLVTLDYPINGSFSNGLFRYTANNTLEPNYMTLNACEVYVNGTLIDTNRTGTGELTAATQFTLNLSRTAVTVSDGPNLNVSVLCNDSIGNTNRTGLFLNSSGSPNGLSGISQLIFTKDTVFPIVRILSPIDNSNQSSRAISIQVNMTDLNADSCILFTNHTGTFALNGTDRAVTNANLSFNITIGNDVQFRYNVSCNDSAGNTIINKSSNTVAADFQTITIDNTPPLVTLDYPINGSFSNGLFRYTANNTLEPNYMTLNACEVYVNGTLIDTNRTGTGELTAATQFTLNLTRTAVTVSDGPSLNVSVLCNDSIGNTNRTGLFLNGTGTRNALSGAAQLIFTKDTVLPVVNLFDIVDQLDNRNQSGRMVFFYVNMTDTNPGACVLYTNHSGEWGINQTNNSVASNGNTTFNITIPNDRRFVWNALCNDSAGNQKYNLSSNTLNANNRTVTVDTVPPSVVINYPINASFSNGLLRYTANNTVTNVHTCQLYIAGAVNSTNRTVTGELSAGTAFTMNISNKGVADGSVNAYVSCNDTVGNVNTSALFYNISNVGLTSGNLTFTLDTVLPIVNLLAPIDNYNQSGRMMYFYVNVTDTNANSCVLYTNDTGAFGINQTNNSVASNYNTTFNFTISSDKSIKWNALCNDSAGNQKYNFSSNTVSNNNKTQTTDATNPAITINLPTLNASVKSSLTNVLNFTVTDFVGLKSCGVRILNRTGTGALELNYSFTALNTSKSEILAHSITAVPELANFTWSINCTDIVDNLIVANSTFLVDSSSITVIVIDPRDQKTSINATNVINYSAFPINFTANVSGTNLDKVWYIINSQLTGAGSNESTTGNANEQGGITSVMTLGAGTNQFRANVSMNVSQQFGNLYRGPGVHSVWYCANNTAGTKACAATQMNYVIRGVNITELENTFTSGLTIGGVAVSLGTLNITLESWDEVAVNTMMTPLERNYTFIINRTDADGNNIIVELVGFSIDENRIANASNSNMTAVDENANFRDAVGGQGYNLSLSWFDVARFIPDAASYKFGRIIMPSLNRWYYYCNGTFASPTCFLLNNCSASITNDRYINYSNHLSFIPNSSGCYAEISGRAYIYLDHFEGGGGVNDTTPPNITFNRPFNGLNVSDNTTPINISFADAGSGINNATININISITSDGGANYSNAANITCYNRSAVTQINPANATTLECNFTASRLADSTQVNITVYVSDGSGNRKVDSIRIAIDSLPPVYNIWNITDGTNYTSFTFGTPIVGYTTGNHTGFFQSARQATALHAYFNYSDTTTDTENVYLQVENSSESDGWTTVLPIWNATNGNISRIIYTLSDRYNSYQSGTNLSFRLLANDSSGNINTSITNITIQVNDTVAPNIELRINGLSDNRTNITETNFTVHWNVTDTNPIQEINMSIDGVTSQTGTCNDFIRHSTQSAAESNKNKTSRAFSPADCGATLTNASHFVTVRARDSWGNVQTTFFNFTVDNTAPTYSLITPSNISDITSSTVINISVWDNVSSTSESGAGVKTTVYTSSCNSTNTSFTNNTDFTPFNLASCSGNNQQKTLTIYLVDHAGNTKVAVLTYRIDDVAPTINLNSPLPNSVWSANVTVNWTVNDSFNNISSIGYFLDDDPTFVDLSTYISRGVTGNHTNFTTRNISVGTHTIKFFANDTRNNPRNTSAINISVTGSVNMGTKRIDLNNSLGPLDLKFIEIRILNGSNGYQSTTVGVQVNTTNQFEIFLELNSTGKIYTLNVTISGLNGSATNWDKNFTVTGTDSTTSGYILSNYSANVVDFVKFNSSLDAFVSDVDKYYGTLFIPFNATKSNNRTLNPITDLYFFANEGDLSSKTNVNECTGEGKTSAYTATSTTPCFNVTGNFSTMIFLPHFSVVAVVNDTTAPTVTVFTPAIIQNESVFEVNITVASDAAVCKYALNGSSNVTMTLSGTTCLGGRAVALANVPANQYNITFTVNDTNGNVNVTVRQFNVSDATIPQINDIINTSIGETSAIVNFTSNEYVNYTIRYGTNLNLSSNNSNTSFGLKRSFKVTLSSLSESTTYSFNITLCDAVGNCNTTTLAGNNFTTSAKAAEKAAEAAAAAAGGGGGVAVAKEANVVSSLSHGWSSVGVGETAVMKIKDSKIAFTQVTFIPKSAIVSASLEVASLKNKPSDLPAASGKVYQYLELAPKNIKESDIEKAVISFSVTKKWLEQNKAKEDEITLFRYSKAWKEHTTNIVSSTADKVDYEAITPGFSTFAIGVKSAIAPPPKKEEKPAERRAEKPLEPLKPVEKPKEAIVPVKPKAGLIIAVIIVVVIVVIAVYFLSRKKAPKEK